MHPSAIMSYYPTYSILDEIVADNKYDSLNIFIDLKNCLQSLYMEHTIINLVESTKMSGRHDTSIFTALLSFIRFHKEYSAKRGIKIKFYIFFESGISYYHNNISKRYKISRRVDNLYDLDAIDREMFHEILRQNFGFIEKAFNRMPDIKVIRLLNLEADFIPYYLITRGLVDTSPNVANVTYSNDHDLCQNVGDHSFVFSKTPKAKKIVRKGQGMDKQLQNRECCLTDEFQPLAIATIGDTGDDVIGIKGLGPATFAKNASALKQMIGGDMETLYENVRKNKPIFETKGIFKNKILKEIINQEQTNKLISNNLKLVSFELISRYFEDPDTTEMLERKRKFEAQFNSEEITDFERMNSVLLMNNVEIQGEDLDIIYTKT